MSNPPEEDQTDSDLVHLPSSKVESHLLSISLYTKSKYEPTEKISTYIVENFPSLGKAAALRFLEWTLENPNGVCSLPTGKTPEYFIKWVQKILKEWPSIDTEGSSNFKNPHATKEVEKVLDVYGFDKSKKPDLSNLTFVQIDEFYPISPEQKNSFNWYVREFYLKGFGMSEEKAVLDLL